MSLTFADSAQQLDYEAGKLMNLSRDPYFTEYLGKLREMCRNHPEHAEEYRQQLIEKYSMYQSRQLEAGIKVPPFFTAVYEGGEAPIVEKRNQPAAAGSVEFAIGGIVLSVLGVIFVLAAGISLATNFMTAFYQGIMLYVCCLVIFLFSELFVAKRLPKMSYVLTAMALSGAFLSTVINHFYLAKFELYTALVIALILTVVSCFFAWKKQTSLYSIIGFIASYLCASILGTDLNLQEYGIVMGTTLLLNLLWVLLPVKKEKQAFPCMMLAINALFLIYASQLDIYGCSTEDSFLMFTSFIGVSWLLYNIIFLVACGRTAHLHSLKKNNVSALGITYLVFSCVYNIIYSLLEADYHYGDTLTAGGFVILGAFGLFSIIAFAILHAKDDRRWSYAFLVAIFMILSAGTHLGSEVAPSCFFVVMMLATLVVCKIHPNNVIIKLTNLFLCVIMIYSVFDVIEDAGEPYFELKTVCLVLAAVMVFAFRTGFVTAGQCLATVVLSVIPEAFVPELFTQVVEMGIVLLLSLLVNYVPYFRVAHYRAYNWFTFAFTCVWMLGLNSGKYDDYLILRVIIAIIGLGIMVLTCSEHYELPLAGKYLVIFVYLTYVALALGLESDLLVSALIMAIALVAVGSGFFFHKRVLRIYGLALALLVCGKLVFYDLHDLEKLEKTILYFVIGVIALGISAIYLVLEKKLQKEAEKKSVSDTAEQPVIYEQKGE